MYRDAREVQGLVDEEGKPQGEVVLAIKRAAVNTFAKADWLEVGYLTGTKDYIKGHNRLLRSLYWNDSDYEGNALEAIEYIVERDRENLLTLLELDPVEEWLQENEPEIHGLVAGVHPIGLDEAQRVQEAEDSFDVEREIRRIREGMDDDPALAVGSTKELLESVCKTVLGIHGPVNADDMPALFKQVQDELGIDPAAVDDQMEGADQMRKFLGSMSATVSAVVELRNNYGTGHGRSQSPALEPEAARLAVAAGTAVAAYVMERYRKVKGAEIPS